MSCSFVKFLSKIGKKRRKSWKFDLFPTLPLHKRQDLFPNDIWFSQKVKTTLRVNRDQAKECKVPSQFKVQKYIVYFPMWHLDYNRNRFKGGGQ